MTKARELTGRHVLAMVLAFFGVMIIANAAFVIVAVKSFPGESEKKSYLQGLQYNNVLAKRATQAALGWRAEISRIETTVNGGLLEVRFFNARDAKLSGLTIKGEMRRPADDDADRALLFHETAPGVYQAATAPLAAGAWDVSGTAESISGDAFDFRARVLVQ